MRQYRFILFKDGHPWKGLYDEVDFINEYDHAFDELRKQYDKMGIYNPEAIHEIVIPEFFWRYQPVKYDTTLRRFVSLLREYIIGTTVDEASVVYGIDWENLGARERALFEWIDKWFKKTLGKMTKEEIQSVPEFGVTRGSKNLSKL